MVCFTTSWILFSILYSHIWCQQLNKSWLSRLSLSSRSHDWQFELVECHCYIAMHGAIHITEWMISEQASMHLFNDCMLFQEYFHTVGVRMWVETVDLAWVSNPVV
jgi:hypothetical protein